MRMIESIEPRRLMAVTVTAVGNIFSVRGDDAADTVILSTLPNSPRRYLHADGLTLNGAPVDGRLFLDRESQLMVDLGGGNDRFEWTRASFGTPVSINLGAGDDRFTQIEGYTLDGLTIDGGPGRDRFTLTDVATNGFANYPVSITDRQAPTRVSINNPWIKNLTIATGNSADTIMLTGGYINAGLFIAARGGNDVVDLVGYLQPSDQLHSINAGAGMNRVADRPQLRPPATGRLDVTVDGPSIDIRGTGPISLEFAPKYGSMEETIGTVLSTDANLYINGIRKPTRYAFFDRDQGLSVQLLSISLDDSPQTVNLDYDGLNAVRELDIATSGGNDEVNTNPGPAVIRINAGTGDDRVNVGTYDSDTAIQLGAGRDRLVLQGTDQRRIAVYDSSRPANLSFEGFGAASLLIDTSDSVDTIAFTDARVKSLYVITRGGVDGFTETRLRTGRRTVDLGPQ